GREAVEDEPARARGEDVDERPDERLVLGLGVQRSGELALDAVERLEELLLGTVAEQQHDRPEALLEQPGLAREVGRGGAVRGRGEAKTRAVGAAGGAVRSSRLR